MREQKKQNLTDPNVRKRFVTYKEAAELYSMGLTRIQEHTKMQEQLIKWVIRCL